MSFDYCDGDDDQDTDAAIQPPAEPLPLPKEVSIAFTVYARDIQDRLLQQVGLEVKRLFDAHVAKTVTDTVAELVEQISREQIESAVRAALSEGWTITDEYGGAKGTASLKDRISKMLNNHNRYSGNGTWIERVMREETDKALRGDIQKEIDAAKIKIAGEVDTVIRAKLAAVLRQSLGVA